MPNALGQNVDAAIDWGLSADCRTRSGVIFDATADVWKYRDGVSDVNADFGKAAVAGEFFKNALKKVMVSIVKTVGPETVKKYSDAMIGFLVLKAKDGGEVSDICGADYLKYKLSQIDTKKVENVRSVLRRWHRLNISGLSDDLMDTLKITKLKIQVYGTAVATRDPVFGPFTDIEFEAINKAIALEYSNGNISPSTFAMSMIFIAVGARPTQLAAMKVKDVKVISVPGGEDYSIYVPRAKQRTGPRADFKNRPLIKSIGRFISSYAKSVEASFISILDNPKDAPLFPCYPGGASNEYGFEYHSLSSSISFAFSKAMSRIRVISERTGEPINITPIRFRRTFGTRAAQEGHGLMVIAELLDHSSTRYAGVYIDTRPDIAARIDRAVALELAPIAQAFEGKIIRSESYATRKGDESSRIRDLRVSSVPLASCGQFAFCNMSAPIACYTCVSFEPWLDGDHEAVLDYLLQRRGIQLNEISARIATVHDRTIIAVAQVVNLCRQQRDRGDISPESE